MRVFNQLCLFLAKRIFRCAIWDKPTTKERNTISLTFDDGPHPEITPWVLDQLKTVNAKATFFCVGSRAAAYPEIIARILAEGHAIGSHSQTHAHGWHTKFNTYKDEVLSTANLLGTKLFRPPYGKLTWQQYRWVSKHYTLVMWSLLSKDYDKGVTPEACVNRVLHSVKGGDVIVFHDSEKAKKNLSVALPIILKELQERDFKCESI
jgi:peptidoglycan/xylan/chitin deacetylase (PgdA/CDA1 family)